MHHFFKPINSASTNTLPLFYSENLDNLSEVLIKLKHFTAIIN